MFSNTATNRRSTLTIGAYIWVILQCRASMSTSIYRKQFGCPKYHDGHYNWQIWLKTYELDRCISVACSHVARLFLCNGSATSWLLLVDLRKGGITGLHSK